MLFNPYLLVLFSPYSQESKCKDSSEYFDIRTEALSPDTLAVPHFSGSLWSPSSGQLFPQRSESANAISSDVLRQNIYENFMRELDLSRTNVENTDTSTETEDSSSESLSSLEQLDLLYEKEQGVVRKAGWLFFKPLVTLQKEKKLELVTRRKWKQYWVTLKGKYTWSIVFSSCRVGHLAVSLLFFSATVVHNPLPFTRKKISKSVLCICYEVPSVYSPYEVIACTNIHNFYSLTSVVYSATSKPMR